jgi:hypothetical protein
VIESRVVWRVPIEFCVLRFGRLGTVGAVDVDSETGEMYQLPRRQREIEHCAGQLAARLPQFQPLSVSDEFIPKDILPAPKLILVDE